LLTNSEVIAVDQFSYENRAVVWNDTTAIWLARRGPSIADEKSRNQSYYLAVFNIGDSEQTVHYEWKDLGLRDVSYKVRDLWEHKNAESAQSLAVKLQPHSSVLYELMGKQ
jgi:alpha-galactosidase